MSDNNHRIRRKIAEARDLAIYFASRADTLEEELLEQEAAPDPSADAQSKTYRSRNGVGVGTLAPPSPKLPNIVVREILRDHACTSDTYLLVGEIVVRSKAVGSEITRQQAVDVLKRLERGGMVQRERLGYRVDPNRLDNLCDELGGQE